MSTKDIALGRYSSMPEVGGAPIVESGSNSDGDWIRWADGTLQGTRVVSSINTSTTASHTWVFPAESITEAYANLLIPVGSNTTEIRAAPSGYSSGKVNATFYISHIDQYGTATAQHSTNIQADITRNIFMFYSGRWK